jgi:protease-4
MSLMLNLLVLAAVAGLVVFYYRSGGDTDALTEKHLAGKKQADNRVAVVRLDGPLMEGLLGYVEKQIEQAATDRKVKAVVLRINSPGGSITASDQLHHRLVRLRDGMPEKNTSPKPLVVSMASLAASGGYYVAMPAKVLYAERTTLTGSIGVYASFPNVRGLADKVGVEMTIVSRGDVKTAGSPFRDMRPEERALWQAMVDHAYDQFKQVVEEGRPDLKGKLEEKVIDEKRSVRMDTKDGTTETKEVPYIRRRADGGIFTADQAKQFGLIDRIGYLEDAVKEAAEQAGLGDNYEAIEYERPFSLTEALLGIRAPQGQALPDAARLADGLTPRLWYLAPQSELSGLLAATQERR